MFSLVRCHGFRRMGSCGKLVIFDHKKYDILTLSCMASDDAWLLVDCGFEEGF